VTSDASSRTLFLFAFRSTGQVYHAEIRDTTRRRSWRSEIRRVSQVRARRCEHAPPPTGKEASVPHGSFSAAARPRSPTLVRPCSARPLPRRCARARCMLDALLQGSALPPRDARREAKKAWCGSQAQA
jgi:hypothetical protein